MSVILHNGGRYEDYLGKKIGMRLILGLKRDNSEAFFFTKCDCGTEKWARAVHVVRGVAGNCGCVRAGLFVQRRTKYGHIKNGKHSKEYTAWRLMLKRVRPGYRQAKDYHQRGITVHESFLDFRVFLNHIGYAPSLSHSLDRINNDGNYEPGNVRWADRSTQNNNRRGNHRLTFNNESHTVTEWSKLTGVSSSSILHRIHLGWPVERILSVGDYRTKQFSTRSYERNNVSGIRV